MSHKKGNLKSELSGLTNNTKSNRKKKKRKKRVNTGPVFLIKWKIFLVSCFIAFIGLVLIKGLFSLQIVHHDECEEKIIKNTISDQQIEPARGDIYDANMELLAKSADVWDIYIAVNDYYIKENGKTTANLNETRIKALSSKLEELFGYTEEELRNVCRADNKGKH